MKTSPAFQFYPGDYLRSMRVQLMSLEEEGAYIRLLSYCWLNGSIPADPESARKLIGKNVTLETAKSVLCMFQKTRNPDKLIHERLEAERRKQEQWRLKSSFGGVKSAKKRAVARISESTTETTVVQPPHQPNLNQHPNQIPTLQSPVSSLQTPVTNTLPAEPAKERPRNLLIDALATFEGIPLAEIAGDGARLGTALKKIKLATPEVTAAEIARRGENYRQIFPDCATTANALAKNWGKCHAAEKKHGGGDAFDQSAYDRLAKAHGYTL